MSRRPSKREIRNRINYSIKTDPLEVILGDSFQFYMNYLRDVNFLVTELMKKDRVVNYKRVRFTTYEKYASYLIKALLLDNGNSDVITNFFEVIAIAKFNNNLEFAIPGTVKIMYEKFYIG